MDNKLDVLEESGLKETMKVVYFVAGAYSFLAYKSREQILVIKLGERRYRKKFTRKCLPYLPGSYARL